MYSDHTPPASLRSFLHPHLPNSVPFLSLFLKKHVHIKMENKIYKQKNNKIKIIQTKQHDIKNTIESVLSNSY